MLMGMGLAHRNQERSAPGVVLLVFLAALALLGLQAASSSLTAADADADLAVSKGDSPDPVTAGSALTYTIQVVNAGPGPAANGVVIDDLPKGVSFVSAQSSQGVCGASGRRVTCTLGTLG